MPTPQPSRTEFNRPLVYQIRVEGHLGRHSTRLFADLSVTLEDNDRTLITGVVVDQAALHGLLRRVRDAGMTLVSVVRVEMDQAG